ncbi:MAG: hypothetical protein H6673_06120 [Anaerolineales bacterium]|nr:hypothetical protein [Anaerolineales bacterium]
MSFHISDQWLWRVVVGGTIMSMGLMGGMAWLLSQGFADPPAPPSTPLWQDTQLDWVPSTTLDSDTFSASTSPFLLPESNLLLEAQAYIRADPLAAWGLWLLTKEGNYLVVGINGSQYVTARLCPTLEPARLEDCPPTVEPTQHILMYWKTYHHLYLYNQVNTVQLVQAGDVLVLRLNQEWMWDIHYQPPPSRIQWGVWVYGGPTGGFIDWNYATAGVSE